MRYGVDRVILAVVGLLVVGFVVWGVLQPDAVLAVSSAALDWVMLHAGWLFAAGIGIGIIFFGPYEPLTYYLAPRPGAYGAGSEEAVTARWPRPRCTGA